MTNKEIIEGNRLIAEFMGLKRGWWVHQEKPLIDDKKQWCDLDGKTFLGSKVYFDNDLKFHSLWDWIMPIVQRISELDYEIIFEIKPKWEESTFSIYNCENILVDSFNIGLSPVLSTLVKVI